MYQRLLVPLDGSGLAEAALAHAEEVAAQFDAEIILLRVVVSPYAIAAPDLVLATAESDMHQLSAQAEEYLKNTANQLRARGLQVRSATCEGPVAEAILEHAEALNAGLVVMSTHGRGGVSRWVYGSVADRVLQGSSCPVLLIRAAV
jgi:nucleotide-binding universal stress UspA family protein